MVEQIITIITAVLAGIAACIPLAVQLVKVVKVAIQEKNWGALLDLVIKLMQEAEEKFNDGATRKEWVMAMVQTSAEYINYPVDSSVISSLIDSLCAMTKVINPPTTPETVQEGETI